MKLKQWIMERGIRNDWFAKQIGTSQAWMSGIANGTKRPSKFLAMRISEYTKGEVTIEELRKK